MVTRDTRGFAFAELMIALAVALLTIGAIVQIFTGVSRSYTEQRIRIDAQHNARAAADMIARLVRMAETVNPDPDGNQVLDSIRLVADWNPADGATDDPYENVTFTVANGTLFKQEPVDPVRVPFADQVSAVAFAYADTNDAPLANPISAAAQIARVTMTLISTRPPGGQALTFQTSASIRGKE